MIEEFEKDNVEAVDQKLPKGLSQEICSPPSIFGRVGESDEDLAMKRADVC